ncbi:MAG: PrsW family intramembrane metalloprotease [Caldilineaceae bacterium]|nr:PrsW family intramembrane metalloprotease [Caldilineaceae bacterium]
MRSINTTRPTELALATYGSPLRKPILGWGLGVALIALIAFALWQQIPFFTYERWIELRVFLLAMLITGLITVIPILILRWLDRREPEPWFMYGLAFLWGGLIATGISGDINRYLDDTLGFLSVVGTGPFVEEITKGLGLLVFLLLLREEFDGPRDGFIYGALIGLGFNWLETSVYIVRGFIDTGVVPWSFQLTSRYVLLGLDGHALYTAITGTFIGFALLQTNLLRKIGLVLLGFLLASLTHLSWNSLGVIISAAVAGIGGMMIYGDQIQGAIDQGDISALPVWLSLVSNIIAVLVANGIGYLIVLLGLRRSGRWERKVMVEQLQSEEDAQVVTPAEYANIEGKCEPPRHDEAARQIFVAQCNLAKRKFYLDLHKQPIESDPLVSIWRDEVHTLRQRRTTE